MLEILARVWYNGTMWTKREILTPQQAAQINVVTLAFLGDTIYSLYVRERLVLEVGGKSASLQRAAGNIVSAQGQSEFLSKVEPLFTEEESDVFRRAKNAKKSSKSKSASHLEYNRSTGLEAVLGYLYLTGREERIKELLSESDSRDYAAIALAQQFKPVRR